MLITFESKAASSVMMFGDVATHFLQIMGKNAEQKGVITVEQLPEAIERLRHVAAVSKAANRQQKNGEASEENNESRHAVSLAQRAVPLVELLESAHRAKEPVLWGI